MEASRRVRRGAHRMMEAKVRDTEELMAIVCVLGISGIVASNEEFSSKFCDGLKGSIDLFFGIVVHTTEPNHSLGFCLESGRQG